MTWERVTRRTARVLVAAAALLAGGCALSPQAIDVAPQLQASPPVAGGGRSMALAVTDARPQQAFGTRGGVYAATAFVAPADDITVPIRAALAARLREAGFLVQPAGAPADLDMQVTVRAIDYIASGSPNVRAVQTRAVVEVRVEDGTQVYKGESKVSASREVLKAPGLADNERMINTIIGQALDRLLENAELNAFLAH